MYVGAGHGSGLVGNSQHSGRRTWHNSCMPQLEYTPSLSPPSPRPAPPPFSYLLPKGHREFHRRLAASLGLLVGAKLLNVQVPFLFKHTGKTVGTAGYCPVLLGTAQLSRPALHALGGP